MVVTSCDRYDRKLGDVTVVRGDEFFRPTEPRGTNIGVGYRGLI